MILNQYSISKMKDLLNTLCLCSWYALYCLSILYNNEYLQFYASFFMRCLVNHIRDSFWVEQNCTFAAQLKNLRFSGQVLRSMRVAIL